jgi:DNA-binding response OmpR family regulator
MRFNVSCARDGGEAIGFLLTRQFDVVLTAFNTPGLNGWTLLTWMRKHRPGVPVCMMSADSATKGFCTAIEPYVDGMLAKPFSIVALEACIKRAVLRNANCGSFT